MKKIVSASEIITRPFVDLPALSMNIKNLQELRQQLESMAERAAMMAAYLDEREGYGCGDQGHKKALKNMNKAGKMIHMKVFGYNAFHELNF